MQVCLNTLATKIDVAGRRLHLVDESGVEDQIAYDQLVVGTGAVSVRPPIEGLAGPEALGPADGVHLLHSMGDTFELVRTIEESEPTSAAIVGAGYIGLEMAEGLLARGLSVTQFEQLPEVLPTVDPSLGALVKAELTAHGVDVQDATRRSSGSPGHRGDRPAASGSMWSSPLAPSSPSSPTWCSSWSVSVPTLSWPWPRVPKARHRWRHRRGPGHADRPGSGLRRRRLRGDPPSIIGPHLPAARDHRAQAGPVAGENAIGGSREFVGSLGTQVVKVFDMAVSRTGLRDHEAVAAGFDPVTVEFEADDHKAYYPGSHRIRMRFTGDRTTGRLLGVQLFGHRHAEVAKRIDIAATAIFNEMSVEAMSDLDLSYTPPLGSPWDAVQMGAQAWVRAQVSRGERARP